MLFAKRWFSDEAVITCVRWYLRFRFSYRDLAELSAELGVRVSPSTIFVTFPINVSQNLIYRKTDSGGWRLASRLGLSISEAGVSKQTSGETNNRRDWNLQSEALTFPYAGS